MIKAAVVQLGAGLILDRPASRRSYAAHEMALTASGAALDARCAAAPATPVNLALLRHIVGIERWGQRRLRSALGEPQTSDEMDGYLPPTSVEHGELCALIQQTRAETISIIRTIAEAQIAPTMRLRHNSFGPLTVAGWLRYLAMHAEMESWKLRRS